GPCPRLKEGSPWVAFGGHANAFERFAVSQVLRLGSGRRLPRGLRRPCRRLPLVRRADPGKKPGGIPVRPLSRADRTALGPPGRRRALACTRLRAPTARGLPPTTSAQGARRTRARFAQPRRPAPPPRR